jgi:hypothetical protein
MNTLEISSSIIVHINLTFQLIKQLPSQSGNSTNRHEKHNMRAEFGAAVAMRRDIVRICGLPTDSAALSERAK